ncbi:hypothetical protein 278BB001_262 [Bacillus phage 278BB001]|nr:hypothetical protein 278BB001_262 [Bacillus phage 278BB001]
MEPILNVNREPLIGSHNDETLIGSLIWDPTPEQQWEGRIYFVK